MRDKNAWDVTLSDPNGGEVVELRLEAYWDPDKVEHEEVARVAAIEANYWQPKDSEGHPVRPLIPVSAALAA